MRSVLVRTSSVLGDLAFGHVLNPLDHGIPKEKTVHIAGGGELCRTQGGDYGSVIAILTDERSGGLGDVGICLGGIFIYSHPDGLSVAGAQIKGWKLPIPDFAFFRVTGRK